MNSHPAHLHSRTAATPVEAANWNAVFALSLSVVGLVTAELLPISLLTPMAADLTVSEGVAGQAVTTSAIVARRLDATSGKVAGGDGVFRRRDRRLETQATSTGRCGPGA